MKKLFNISVHDLLTWTHYAWMPLFFFDALFLVLTSSSSSCRYMLHLRFSQEGCFVAYQHTVTKRVACAYNIVQVAALCDRLFFIIFYLHAQHTFCSWTQCLNCPMIVHYFAVPKLRAFRRYLMFGQFRF